MHCDFQGKRVLIVEDNFLAAAEMAFALEAANAVVVGPCDDLEEATLQVLHSELAILDIDVQGRKSFALADRLLSLEIPYVFFTGYHPSLLPKRFAKIECITKVESPVVAIHLLNQQARASEVPRIADLIPLMRQKARSHMSDPLAADRLVERALQLAIDAEGPVPSEPDRSRWLLQLMDAALLAGKSKFFN
jgi:CheY-like chemotaxis protein